MRTDQPLPALWLFSDARNDRSLEETLAGLPRGSGFVYRHYHLLRAERLARWLALRHLCRTRGHLAILAANAITARAWGADGCYGAPRAIGPQRAGLLRIAAVHKMSEIAQASRKQADAVFLSPVFPTRTHPGAPTLGPLRFRLLARHAPMPVIALGGMTARTARRLGWPRWAAIDGLSGNLDQA